MELAASGTGSGPLKQQVDEWRTMEVSTAAEKLLIYQAFIEKETGFPKHWAGECTSFAFSQGTRNSSPAPCGTSLFLL